MMQGAPDPKDVGRAYAMAQVGFEMVAPIGLGVALDYWLGWTPWATVAGAVLGFVGGLIHLVSMLNKDNRDGPSKPRAGSPQ
jgi:F0F1-type ATP synthase assembly protein I